MKPSACSAAAVLALTVCLGVAKASGPIAVYALVDKVAFEPNENKPERIRLSGVFITAEDNTGTYSAPRRGYLYFTLPGVNSELAQREWRDLTQLYLSFKTGLSQGYVSDVETGRRKGTAAALRRIADVLKVPLDLLVSA